MKVYNYSSLNRQQHVSSSRRKLPAKRARTHLGLFNNPFKLDFSTINSFYFQIAGILMITIGVVISFQTLMDISSPQTSAGSVNNRDSVRVLTNFETETKRSIVPKVEIIQSKAVVPAENAPEVKKDIVTTTTVETPTQTVDQETKTSESDLDNSKLQTYIVLEGDTLAVISGLFGIAEAEFIEVNKLTPPYYLQAGQKLLVPVSK
jgi:LysM repeat protein